LSSNITEPGEPTMLLMLNLGHRLAAHRDYLKAKLGREDGVTAMEYGLIAALIAIVIILALTLAGEALNNIFNNVACVRQGGEFAENPSGEFDTDCDTS
jgi:pilus assembly protein Flp/PilA